MKKILIFLLTITGMASLSAAKLNVGFSKRGGGWVEVKLLGAGGKQLIKYKLVADKDTGFTRKTFNISGGIEAILWACDIGSEFYAHLGISKMSLFTNEITIYECNGNYTYGKDELVAQKTGGVIAKRK